MRTTLVTAALVALLAGCSGGDAPRDDTGAVEQEGDVSAFSLQVGDCIVDTADAPDEEQVEQLPAVPCDQPHDGEVYAVTDLPDGEFPGEAAVDAAVEETCTSAFEDFVGLAYEESAYDYYSLQPTEETWEQLDDREVVCVVVSPEEQVTGSLEGSAQ